jgi:EmrB/QacA subfamily drug resistance transporter
VIFAIVSVALFMASIDTTIVATALPRIERSLHSPLNWAGWTITIYALGQIVAMPLSGKLSDHFGRKKIFLIAAAVFTTASLLCGLATSIYMLIALRGVQALGGGAFVPSATGIISDHFGRDRDRALGMFTSIFPIGGIVGPVFGGLIAQYWSWRGIFFINVPLGVVLISLGIHFIPRREGHGTGMIDYKGVALLAATILTAMFGITSLGNPGARIWDPSIVGAEIVAVIAGFLFIRHTKRSDAPFIPMQLLAGKGFLAMNILNVLFGMVVLGFGALVPLYAENRYGISIANAGTLLSARGVGMICVATAAVFAIRRTGYRLPMTIGFATVAIGMVMLAVRPHGVGPYAWLTIFSALTGLGMGIAAPSTNNATLQLAPDQVAAIAGLRGMFRQSGGICYIAVATAVLARSPDPGLAQARIFLILAAMIVVMIGLVYVVPDHKGSW